MSSSLLLAISVSGLSAMHISLAVIKLTTKPTNFCMVSAKRSSQPAL